MFSLYHKPTQTTGSSEMAKLTVSYGNSSFGVPNTSVTRLGIYMDLCGEKKSRDSSVGIATSYGLDGRGSRIRFPAGTGNFSLHHRVQNGSGAPPSLLSNGYQRPFP
jgi:hypothetical protein